MKSLSGLLLEADRAFADSVDTALHEVGRRERAAEALLPFHLALIGVFTRRQSLSLLLSGTGASVEGTRIFAAGRAAGALWSNAFHAGIRTLTLSKGLTLYELVDLVTALAPSASDVQSGQDQIATALWRLDLGHVEFSCPERAVFAADDDPTALAEEIKRRAREVAKQLASRATEARRLQPQFAANQAGLREHLDPDQVFPRSLAVLMTILKRDAAGRDSGMLTHAFRTYALSAMDSDRPDQVVGAMHALKNLSASTSRSQRIRLDRILAGISDEMLDRVAIAKVSSSATDLSGLSALLELLGKGAARPYAELCLERRDATLSQAVGLGLAVSLHDAPGVIQMLFERDPGGAVLAPFLSAMCATDSSQSSTRLATVLEAHQGHRNREVNWAITSLLATTQNIQTMDGALAALATKNSTQVLAASRFFSQRGDERSATELAGYLSAAAPPTADDRYLLGDLHRRLGSMRTATGLAFLQQRLLGKSLLGAWKAEVGEQVLAVDGLLAAGDRLAAQVLDRAAGDTTLPGPVRAALKKEGRRQ
jgi:hypothetical protein